VREEKQASKAERTSPKWAHHYAEPNSTSKKHPPKHAAHHRDQDQCGAVPTVSYGLCSRHPWGWQGPPAAEVGLTGPPFFFFLFLGGRAIHYTYMDMQRKKPQVSNGRPAIHSRSCKQISGVCFSWLRGKDPSRIFIMITAFWCGISLASVRRNEQA